MKKNHTTSITFRVAAPLKAFLLEQAILSNSTLSEYILSVLNKNRRETLLGMNKAAIREHIATKKKG